jgi:hypothetical protein
MGARNRRNARAVAKAVAVDLERERCRITRWMAASLAALFGSWALVAAGLR